MGLIWLDRCDVLRYCHTSPSLGVTVAPSYPQPEEARCNFVYPFDVKGPSISIARFIADCFDHLQVAVIHLNQA